MNGLALLRGVNQVLGVLAPQWSARRARWQFTHPRRRAQRPWEVAVEEGAERLTLRVGWRALRWAPSGAARGRVLCMHGWEGRATQFGELATALVGEGFEVVALDGPGHGQSPEEVAHPVAFARAMLDADRELGPFVAVIGHSMGAGAVGFALHWGLRAQGVVLLASPSSMRHVIGRFGRFIGLPAVARAQLLEEMEAHVGFPADDLDVARVSSAFTQPALIVHDPVDAEVPISDGREIADQWPGAEWLEVTGLGHRRLLRDPDLLARVTRFCAKLGS